MAQSNGRHPSEYSIGVTGNANAELLAITRDAKDDSRGDRVEEAYVAILARLKFDPVTFGEPLYRVQKMSMTIRCAVIMPLYLEYGVHDTRPVVVIRRVVALSSRDA